MSSRTVKVLQLGNTDYSETLYIDEYAAWTYEPDFNNADKNSVDVAIIERPIKSKEFAYLYDRLRPYTLFTSWPEILEDEMTAELFKHKMGKTLSPAELKSLIQNEIRDYFSSSYGEKNSLSGIGIAHGFKGNIVWNGYQSVKLYGDYGEQLSQIAFWKASAPIDKNQSLEFWLEYKKGPGVEIQLEIVEYAYASISTVINTWTFTEEEMNDLIVITNGKIKGSLAISILAKGIGNLEIRGLHCRYSRRGKGNFIPGGNRVVTSDREEAFYFFDPGNFEPPLNVYFSGYKTREGFEGYRMMKNLEHPFLLISEARLEGGAFYLGSLEYELMIERIIKEHLLSLGFDNTQLILSGLSMGTFGALYYGCKLHPDSIIVGKPLTSLGDVAENEQLLRAGGFPTSLDLLKKTTGGSGPNEIEMLNNRFWEEFDKTDWTGTQFAVAYMIEDDYDSRAYNNLQLHLKDAGTQIYGKGLHGRHNDNTSGVVNWFVNQYKEILNRNYKK